jgi:hypothetical protein
LWNKKKAMDPNDSRVGTAADVSPDVTRGSVDSTKAPGFAGASTITYTSQSTLNTVGRDQYNAYINTIGEADKLLATLNL